MEPPPGFTKIPLEIVTCFGCAECAKEIPPGMSPREYARFEVGWTKKGFQVWCTRHEINVIHMDFQGQKHPAVGASFVRRH